MIMPVHHKSARRRPWVVSIVARQANNRHRPIAATFVASTYCALHCVSKNDTGAAHCNFDADQPILVIFGRDIAEKVCYQIMICYPTFPN